MFQLSEVSKSYQRRGTTVHALRATNLTIAEGEYVALVGHSGSGKTTLLSVLGGMLAPNAGEVRLGGQSVYRLSVAQRSRLRRERIGFVFQTFNLVPYLSAIENVQVPMIFGKLAASEQQIRAEALLEQVGLSERKHHKPSELSVGQQQRVALARTMANDPSVILADEPTGNLDPSTREEVLNIFDQFHRAGRTIIVVTHDPSVAARAERRLTLSDGLVSEQGKPEERAA